MDNNNPYSSTTEMSAAVTEAGPKPALRLSAFLTTTVIAIVGSWLLCRMSASVLHGLMCSLVALGPLLVTAAASFFLQSSVAQAVLAISSLLYGVWFGYIYIFAVYINPDPQAPIAFMFVGILALPVLFMFWIVAIAVEVKVINLTAK